MLHLLGIFKEMGEGAEVFKVDCTFRSSRPVVLAHCPSPSHTLCSLSAVAMVKSHFSAKVQLDLVMEVIIYCKASRIWFSITYGP